MSLMQHERPLPLLGAIAGFFHWIEELLNILNGPILMFGAGIALVDLLTDGALTLAIPPLLMAWAGSQALGIDTQLLGCFARARMARGWHLVGWLALGLILGFAAWQAGYVFAVQQSERISEAAALSQLGMDPRIWLAWRAFLAVGLVALSGWTRYRKPMPVTLEDERAQLEREIALEPLRQQVRTRKAIGAVGLGRQLLDAARGKEAPERPPTGPGTPAIAAPGRDSDGRSDEATPAVVRFPASDIRRARAARTHRAKAKRERQLEQVRAWLREEGDVSRNELARRLRCSPSHAGVLKRDAIAATAQPQRMAQ